MAQLTALQNSLPGVTLPFVAANAGGDTLAPDDRTALLVKNGSGSSITVTFVTPNTVSGLAIADVVLTVAAGATALSPTLTSALFGDPTSGLVTINYSAVTTVTVQAVRV
jgi:hypothetical protein